MSASCESHCVLWANSSRLSSAKWKQRFSVNVAVGSALRAPRTHLRGRSGWGRWTTPAVALAHTARREPRMAWRLCRRVSVGSDSCRGTSSRLPPVESHFRRLSPNSGAARRPWTTDATKQVLPALGIPVNGPMGGSGASKGSGWGQHQNSTVARWPGTNRERVACPTLRLGAVRGQTMMREINTGDSRGPAGRSGAV